MHRCASVHDADAHSISLLVFPLKRDFAYFITYLTSDTAWSGKK